MLLTYETYFQLYLKRYRSFSRFFKKVKRSKINGTLLNAFLSFEVVPFEFAAFLKAGGYKVFGLFFEPYVYEGVCIAFKRKQFGSSIVLRLIDDGIMFDRNIPIFSPILIYLQVVVKSNFHYSENRPRRSTFYFLSAFSQKKLVSKLFN